MYKYLIVAFCCLLVYAKLSAQSCLVYGLAFNSHETVAEKRTALEIGADKPLCFSRPFRLAFDVNFISNNQIYFGYVLRIVNGNRNIDLLYDQRASLFRVTFGQTFSGISFSCNQPQLFNDWNRLAFTFDPVQQQVSLAVNGKPAGSARFAFDGSCFGFLWGANDHERFQTRDIPPMRLKDIRLLENGKQRYHWSLDETGGNTCFDSGHTEKAIIKNPVWIKPGHQRWHMIRSFDIRGNALVAFDARKEVLLVAGSDSLLRYEAGNRQDAWSAEAVKHKTISIGSLAVYDTITGQLYNLYTDKREVASYAPGSHQWNTGFYDTILTEYWHANKWMSAADTSVYILGGYGQLKYKNKLQRYHLSTRRWDSIATKGDFFPPRYLAALGLNATGDTAFIMGGYGSMTGDQMLDPRHYFDLYAFALKSGTFHKRFELDSGHTRFAFANSLVIDSKNRQYYGLVFPNDRFHSELQLITGSLDKPVYRQMGDAIPYSFYDVQSYADLFYAPGAGKLIAVTLLSTQPESQTAALTHVQVYTIDFPPVALAADAALQQPGRNSRLGWHTGLAFVVAAIGAWLFFFTRRNKKAGTAVTSPVPLHTGVAGDNTIEPAASPVAAPLPHTPPPPAGPGIYLFGPFQVLDQQGADITELFTPLIKELFLLILVHTVRTGRGITSNELDEILWNGKPVKDAKNNRSVNMTKVKNILEKIGHCRMVKQSVFWQFQYEEPLYLDYAVFTQLLKEQHPAPREHITRLLQVVERGAFLHQTEYGWLDDIKAGICNSVIDTCLAYLKNWKEQVEEADLVIRITNGMFFFDRLNEEALAYKCKALILLKRHALANDTYAKFIKDYREMYGEEFYKPFNEVIRGEK
jgi:hypothetical protein